MSEITTVVPDNKPCWKCGHTVLVWRYGNWVCAGSAKVDYVCGARYPDEHQKKGGIKLAPPPNNATKFHVACPYCRGVSDIYAGAPGMANNGDAGKFDPHNDRLACLACNREFSISHALIKADDGTRGAA